MQAIACAWRISTTYWPLILPAPEPVRLTVFAASSRLMLAGQADASRPTATLKPFGAAVRAGRSSLRPVSIQSRVCIGSNGMRSRGAQVIRHEVGDGTVLPHGGRTRN